MVSRARTSRTCTELPGDDGLSGVPAFWLVTAATHHAGPAVVNLDGRRLVSIPQQGKCRADSGHQNLWLLEREEMAADRWFVEVHDIRVPALQLAVGLPDGLGRRH